MWHQNIPAELYPIWLTKLIGSTWNAERGLKMTPQSKEMTHSSRGYLIIKAFRYPTCVQNYIPPNSLSDKIFGIFYISDPRPARLLKSIGWTLCSQVSTSLALLEVSSFCIKTCKSSQATGPIRRLMIFRDV